MTYASQSELTALFYGLMTLVLICTILEEMVHPQMPTLVRMDNSIAHGLITQSMITKALKFIEMDSIIIECIGAQIKFNLLR